MKEETKPTIIARLTKEQETNIFKALAHKSYKEAGKEYGLHLIYNDDDAKITSAVFSIARKIKKAPELWGLSKDTVDVVQQALDSRSVRKNPRLRAEVAIQTESFRDKLDNMRDTVAEIIDKKLKKYNTAKGVDNVQLRDLKDLLGMAIDKGRLLRGESTENIIKHSSINTEDLDPKEALAIVMRAREALVESKK